jgi:hypothetical protein
VVVLADVVDRRDARTEVQVGADASPQQRLLAYTGRDPS